MSDSPEPFVWVYGSLLCATSRRDCVRPRLTARDAERRVVSGWRRSWNCLSAKTFLTTGGVRVRRVVAGLERAPDTTSEGLLLHVDAADLRRLRAREMAYDEVDITGCLDRPPGRVITFVPKRSRTRAAATCPLPLVVERGYFDTCLRGAAEHCLDEAAAEFAALLDLDLAEVAGDVRWIPPAEVKAR